jgi:hypothetical protein
MKSVEYFVSKLFAEDQIDRSEFEMRRRQNTSATLEGFLPPVIRLSKEELALKTGFSQLIADTSEDYRLYNFSRFTEDHTEYLVLHAPKKVEIHHVIQQSRLPLTAATAGPKPQTRQPRASYGVSRPRKRGYQPAIGGMVPEDGDASIAKKFRGDILSDDDDVPTTVEDLRGPPENLKEVITGVFQEFWVRLLVNQTTVAYTSTCIRSYYTPHPALCVLHVSVYSYSVNYEHI